MRQFKLRRRCATDTSRLLVLCVLCGMRFVKTLLPMQPDPTSLGEGRKTERRPKVEGTKVIQSGCGSRRPKPLLLDLSVSRGNIHSGNVKRYARGAYFYSNATAHSGQNIRRALPLTRISELVSAFTPIILPAARNKSGLGSLNYNGER